MFGCWGREKDRLGVAFQASVDQRQNTWLSLLNFGSGAKSSSDLSKSSKWSITQGHRPKRSV